MFRLGSIAIAVSALLIAAGHEKGSAAVAPAGSAMANAPVELQRIILNPIEAGADINQGAWKMKNTFVVAAEGVTPKLGPGALTFGAEEAESAGAKGDFTIRNGIPGQASLLGMWVYLKPDANVATVGFQVYDQEGEALLAVREADWTGWKWVETDLGKQPVEQAYPQKDKNGKADYPLKSVHVVWFTREPGRTELIVDAAVACTQLAEAYGSGLAVEHAIPERVEHGGVPSASLFLTNYREKPVELVCTYSLQTDSALYSRDLPDPVHGSDHVAGCRSWLIADGETIEDGSTTDGLPWTAPGTAYSKEHYTEAFQLVDLGQVRRITKMTWLSGDANHSWLVDVLASQDGEQFAPVPGLQSVDHYKKWGWRDFPVEAPFKAKVLKFRYHTGGEKQNVIRFPSELRIYDGTGDEVIGLPDLGPVVEEGTARVTVPARSFAPLSLPLSKPVETGAHFLGVRVKGDGIDDLSYRHVFAALENDPALVSPDSRFALNSSKADLSPRLAQLGIGWVRFENMKWPFVSPSPHTYAFDGSVGPWHVNADEIFATYRAAGLNILSYMFLTPKWCSSAPADKEKMSRSFPPTDLSLFGEFCFQVVARYGNTKVPADKLMSADKKSGMGLVHYYEMWNEPNLNPSPEATWGGWAAPLDKYYEMMRYGAEAVKQADPTAIVTSAGYAGMRAEMVDRMRTYKYPDGKCPLDFVEVINVHYYSGQLPPETATKDGNANVTGSSTFVEDLIELREWRDRYAPEMPIWMTETGYDSAGSFGTTEAIQAARLPRVVMLCLANGVEKVFVYREVGSTPSKHACAGVLRNDLSHKPSWFTYGTLIRQFKDVRGMAKRLPHPDRNVWLMEWNDGGKPLLTAWTVDGTGKLGTDFGYCTVTDAFGSQRAVASTRDIEVTPYPVYITDVKASDDLTRLRATYIRLEQEQIARIKRVVALKKYLYDFGSTEFVGQHAMEGHKTLCKPVLADTMWDEEKGYGFMAAAFKDDDRPYMGRYRKMDRDSTKVRDHIFQFRVEPGRYELKASIQPFHYPRDIVITGVEGAPVKATVSKKDETIALPVEVKGKASNVAISIMGDYGNMHWITCVENLD